MPTAISTEWPKHLTKDGCWVYWKGIQIEHFTYGENVEGEAVAASRLASICRHLEAIGVPVSTSTAIWFCSWFKDMGEDHPYKRFMSECFGLYEHKGRGLLGWIAGKGILEYWDASARRMGRDPVILDEDGCGYYHGLVRAGWRIADAGQSEHCGVCFATTEGVTGLLRRYGVPEEV